MNADDFGRSSAINQAIVQAHCEGILTSATLMMNEPGTEEAIFLAKANPGLGVGLHLTLADGHSVLPPETIPGLVNERGEFVPGPVHAGFKYFFRSRLRLQLAAEIEAQFARFRDTGLVLDHVDSHHHLHMHPTVMDILLSRARALGITHLRLTRESLSLHRRVGVPSGWDKRWHALAHGILARRASARMLRLGIRHTDAVFGLLQNGRVDIAYLERLLPALPPGDSELFVHPSMDGPQHELRALVSPRIRQLVEALGLRLIRYQEL